MTTKILTRAITTESAPEDNGRVISFIAATETPVRTWDEEHGEIFEILDISAEAINTERLDKRNLAFNVNHDWGKQIGNVDAYEIVPHEKLRIDVRFSSVGKSAEAYTNYKEGVYKNVSISYERNKMVLEDGSTTPPTYRTTRWTPLEVSHAPVPADFNSHIGRSLKQDEDENEASGEAASSNDQSPACDVTEEKANCDENKPKREETPKPNSSNGVKQMTTETIEVTSTESPEQMQERMASIMNFAYSRNLDQKVVERALKERTSFKDFKLEIFEAETLKRAKDSEFVIEKELSPKEQNHFIAGRAIWACVTGNQDGLEEEIHVSRELAKRHNKALKRNSIYVPPSAFAAAKRTQNATLTANEGSDLVYTTRIGHYGPKYPVSVLAALGVSELPGLVGPVDMSWNGVADANWVGEKEAIALSTMATGTIDMVQKTVAGRLKITRKLQTQNNPQMLALMENALYRALEQKVEQGVINGDGVKQPLGILRHTNFQAVTITADGKPTGAFLDSFRDGLVESGYAGAGPVYLGNIKLENYLRNHVQFANTGVRLIDNLAAPLITSPWVPSNYGAGSNLSALVFGDFSNVYVGRWGVIELARSDSDGDDFADGTICVRAMQDVGVMIANEDKAFTISKEIVTA